jgi:hypothetical protein
MVLQPSVLGIIDNILRTKNLFIKYSQIIMSTQFKLYHWKGQLINMAVKYTKMYIQI